MASSSQQLSFAIKAVNEASAVLKQVQSDVNNTGSVASGAAGGLSKFSSTLGDMSKIAGGFVIGQGLMALPGLFSGMIGGASDLSESMSKVNVVFGTGAPAIEAWSKSAATSMGMSKGAALEAVGTFGAFLTAMGQTPGEAQKLSMSMVQLASDMASFNNASPEEVLLALRSGLSGEAEPLKRFGVALSDTAVKAKAMELGLMGVGNELTEQEKIQARYAIIMEQTATAQGDFARTSGGHANQMRILKASLSDISTEFGAMLLPVVVKVGQAFVGAAGVLATFTKYIIAVVQDGDVLNDWLADLPGPVRGVALAFGNIVSAIRENVIPAIRDFVATAGPLVGQALAAIGSLIINDLLPKIRVLAGIFTDTILPAFVAIAREAEEKLGPVLGQVFSFIGSHKEILGGVAVVIGGVLVAAFVSWAVAATMAAVSTLAALAPVIAIGAALALLAAGVIWVVQNWDMLTAKFPVLKTVSDAVKAALEAFVGWITGTLVPALSKIGESISNGLQAAVGPATAAINAVVSAVKAVVDTLAPIVQAALGPIGTIFETQFRIALAMVQLVFGLIKAYVETTIGVITGVIKIAMGLFTGDWELAWEGVKQVVESVWEGIKAVFNSFAGFILSVVPTVLSAAKSLGGAILDGLKAGLTAAGGFVTDIGEAVANAVKGAVNFVIDKINGALKFSIPVKGLPDITVDAPDIPHLAAGGLVTRPTLALIGEAGPEAVIPLNRAPIGVRGGNDGGVTVNINAPVFGVDDLIFVLDRALRRAGQAGLVTT